MSEFLDRISKLSPQRLALLADELNERVQAYEKSRTVPLAIVGIGCRFPGGVQDPDGFWKLLSDGVDAVREVPSSRWDAGDFYDANPDTPGKMATRWGGFIEGADQFDPKFFGIAPAEAISMDPQQRLLLETAWEALEHAGIAPSSLAGTPTGVFVGICNGDYSQVALSAPREKITPYFASGLSHAIAAGRISYVLGLQGPNMAVDTSCSASLVAVHLACQSLRLGECNAALAGGVNLVFNPDITIALSQSHMMAPDGRCKAFSDVANGFVRGEGCGVIVLKRLPDAIRDHNLILAVIRGSACNQDGRSSGLTAPNGPSQEAVVAAALANAGLRPNDVDYIEAHGTGTSLGDPIELGALNAVFADHSGKGEPLYVGSVKTNLGHLESAAGIAGLIKLVLSIQRGKIPASLHFGKPNSRIEWDRLPIEIPTELRTWKRRGEKRVGGVSSFGFSGTNAHVVVEEYVAENDNGTQANVNMPQFFALSAKTESALRTMGARLRDYLTAHPSLALADVAHTLNRGRSHFEYRAGIIASSHQELRELLDRFAKNLRPTTLASGHVAAHSPRVAFVFGDEHPYRRNMARDLYEASPVFRESIQRCEKAFRNDLEMSLISALYPETSTHSDVKVCDETDELPASYQRPAAFALQYALAELWRSCGIKPTVAYGFGVGEYVAACIAGVFSLEDGLRLAIADGRTESAAFEDQARRIQYNPPQVLFVAQDPADAPVNSVQYWLHRTRSTMPSVAALSKLDREHCVACMLVGNGSAPAETALKSKNPMQGKWLLSFDNTADTYWHFISNAAALYVLGFEPDISRLYGGTVPNLVSLPTYPFERERYWLELEEGSESRLDARRDVLQGSVREIESQALAAGTLEPKTKPSSVTGDEWIYDLVWEPKPLVSKPPAQLTAGFEEDLLARLAVVPASEELLRVARLTVAMAPVYATYIVQALQDLGLSPLPTSLFTLEELSERLKILPTRRRLLGRMLGILAEDKIVERAGDRFRFIDFQSRPDADAELQKIGAEYPECLTEVNVLRRCGQKLSAVLRGAYDPLQLVFVDGSIGEAEQIYAQSPVCRFFNDKATQVVRAAVERIGNRLARILEIGGGTGSTTAPILSGLAEKDVEYIFTDVSQVFLSRARGKFSNYPFMRYQVLDIENDPVGQGFEAGGYDIIIAANVLHATADLRRTVAHTRKLLALGGLLLLIEGVHPERWLDLTLGLTDGWWRFADLDLRPEHPLISADTWMRVLREAGMSSTRTISYVLDDGSLSQQRVIVGRADTSDTALARKPRRNWILFADNLGVGEVLHNVLVADGEHCQIIRKPRSSNEIASAFDNLQTQSGVADTEIVYLWGMDTGETMGSSDALLQDAEISSETLVQLIQKMLMRESGSRRLTIATRGAQATKSFSPNVGGAVQSLAWGIGRTLGLELPNLYRALIDLDPSLTPETSAANLFSELFAEDKEDQIAYRNGQRLVARLKNSSLKEEAAFTSIGLREDGSYLLVGGLGGLGLQVAKWAAKQRAGHLVLLGRSGAREIAGTFGAERSKAIEEIRRLGVQVTVIEADVTSEAQMQSLFQRFGTELPALRGVFQMATAVSTAELCDLSREQIETMLRPKVLGTWVLHELTKNLDLDFFLAFSSAASLIGAKGMAHYAAANQFLDSFAHYRRALGLPMTSVNWGAWEIMRRASLEEKNRFTQTGLLPMNTDRIFQLIGDLIGSRRAQVMIANVDWDVLKPILEVHRTRPMFEKFGNGSAKQRSKNGISVLPPSSHLMTTEMTPVRKKEFIEMFVLEQAASVLGFRHGELPPVDVPLTDLGLDSLMAVDLKNRLQSGLGQELSSTIIFDYPTVSDMVVLLETMLWAAHDGVEHDLASAQTEEIRI